MPRSCSFKLIFIFILYNDSSGLLKNLFIIKYNTLYIFLAIKKTRFFINLKSLNNSMSMSSDKFFIDLPICLSINNYDRKQQLLLDSMCIYYIIRRQ